MSQEPYLSMNREQWARLAAATPLTLEESDLEQLQGISEELSMDEVVEVYLPLSRLINLRFLAADGLRAVTSGFLGRPVPRVPFVIGVAGSVAVGKSTLARLLQRLLSAWPDHGNVQLVTTDGFLHSNAKLEELGLSGRKGFPESYDQQALLGFVQRVKAGVRELSVPVYSHLHYDIVPGEHQLVDQPDILILEGLNVLQAGPRRSVSDYFDFGIYLDADESRIRDWFLERFALLRQTAFRDPGSFFRKFAEMDAEGAMQFAATVWETVNAVNLRDNIEPTRERATLVLRKGQAHAVEQVSLRL